MDEEKYKVYKHTVFTKDGEKYYIGQTKLELEKRFQNGMGYKTQLCFFADIVLYGWNNIKHELLADGLTKEDSIRAEKEYIELCKSNNILFGYNILNESYPKGSLNKTSREVICIETGERYGSVGECGRKLGFVNSSWITTHIKQRRGTVKGFHYCYSSNILKLEDFKEPKQNGKRIKCNETNEIFETMSKCSENMKITITYISNSCNGKIKKHNNYSFSFV